MQMQKGKARNKIGCAPLFYTTTEKQSKNPIAIFKYK